MKALLIKDFYNIKEQLKFYIIIFVIYGIFAAVSGNTGSFSGVLIMMITIMLINTISYDERSKWDKFCLCTSISRDKIVGEKYLLGIILFGITAIMSAIFMILVEENMSLVESLTYTGAVEVISVVMLSIILPLIFKLGVEKGRIVMMGVFFVPLFIAFITPFASEYLSFVDLSFLNKINSNIMALLVLMMAAAMYGISYLLSLKFYRGKEF